MSSMFIPSKEKDPFLTIGYYSGICGGGTPFLGSLGKIKEREDCKSWNYHLLHSGIRQ